MQKLSDDDRDRANELLSLFGSAPPDEEFDDGSFPLNISDGETNSSEDGEEVEPAQAQRACVREEAQGSPPPGRRAARTLDPKECIITPVNYSGDPLYSLRQCVLAMDPGGHGPCWILSHFGGGRNYV